MTMGVTELIESQTSREMIPADDKFNPVLSQSASAKIKGFNGLALPSNPLKSRLKKFLSFLN